MYTPANSTSPASVKEQIIKQMAIVNGPVQPTELSYCEKKMVKYQKKVDSLLAKKVARRLTIGEKWAIVYNKERLTYWTEFCNTGIDPDEEDEE